MLWEGFPLNFFPAPQTLNCVSPKSWKFSLISPNLERLTKLVSLSFPSFNRGTMEMAAGEIDEIKKGF